MAVYEHRLKMLVDGFANTSSDFVTWAKFLDLRAMAIGGVWPFEETPHISPPPNNQQPYRPIQDSLADGAVRLADIGDCQEGMMAKTFKFLGLPFTLVVPDPAEKTLGKSLTESELLHLILGWQQLDLGVFKTFMRLYGLAPGDQPQRLHPGPTSDPRLGEEIVSWLVAIQADANNFVANQKFTKSAQTPLLFTQPSSIHDALANLEQQYHRLVDNYLVLLTVLPYHLFLAKP